MRLNRAQKMVVVVGFGLLLLALWFWLEQLGAHTVLTTHQSPDGSTVIERGIYSGAMQTNATLRLIVQAVLVAAWAAPSLWLVRSTRDDQARALYSTDSQADRVSPDPRDASAPWERIDPRSDDDALRR